MHRVYVAQVCLLESVMEILSQRKPRVEETTIGASS